MLEKIKNRIKENEREQSDSWIDPNLMDSHQQRKQKRIMAIANLVKKKGKINYKQFLAEMQFNGLRKIVAEEYLEVMKDLQLITYENEENQRRNEGPLGKGDRGCFLP